jgi:polysaccharide export outer membrane protein
MWIRRVAGLLLVLATLSAAADGRQDKNGNLNSGAAGQPSAADAAKPGSPAISANSSDYVIGDSDILAINVWREQELSRVIPVRPDGKISLPLLGEIQASGLTPAQLQAKITQQLHSLLENPEVTVIVQEALSKHFSIVGEVVKPGSYSLTQRLSVLDALALAGGFRDFAKVGKMYVLRVQADGSSQRLPFKYKQAIKGDISQNFLLQPGDTVMVP